MTLLHFVVFEEKIGPKVKFLTHNQIWKSQLVFSNFASIDWRSVGDNPNTVKNEEALFRQKKGNPLSEWAGRIEGYRRCLTASLFFASGRDVISSCFAKARPSHGSFFLLDKRKQSTYNKRRSEILLTGVYLSPKWESYRVSFSWLYHQESYKWVFRYSECDFNRRAGFMSALSVWGRVYGKYKNIWDQCGIYQLPCSICTPSFSQPAAGASEWTEIHRHSFTGQWPWLFCSPFFIQAKT